MHFLRTKVPISIEDFEVLLSVRLCIYYIRSNPGVGVGLSFLIVFLYICGNFTVKISVWMSCQVSALITVSVFRAWHLKAISFFGSEYSLLVL